MPTGPHGEKRPRSVIANAARVAKISVGEAQEEYVGEPPKPSKRSVIKVSGGRVEVLEDRLPEDSRARQ